MPFYTGRTGKLRLGASEVEKFVIGLLILP
jgi:hypothetical protein